MKNFFLLVLCLSGSLSFFGCGGGAPDGFPKVLPGTVVITDQGQPVSGATVQLLPESGGSGQWNIYGETNAEGRAELRTVQGAFSRPGLPSGKYKVVVTLPPPTGGKSYTDEEIMAMTSQQRDEYQKEQQKLSDLSKRPPEAFGDPEKTTLVFDMSQSGTTTNYDLADYRSK